jgi:hypothetical protein
MNAYGGLWLSLSDNAVIHNAVDRGRRKGTGMSPQPTAGKEIRKNALSYPMKGGQLALPREEATSSCHASGSRHFDLQLTLLRQTFPLRLVLDVSPDLLGVPSAGAGARSGRIASSPRTSAAPSRHRRNFQPSQIAGDRLRKRRIALRLVQDRGSSNAGVPRSRATGKGSAL